jgi:hypothetical protein
MAVIQIKVVTKNVDFNFGPGPSNQPGKQGFFTDDLLNSQKEVVGTRSGFVTRLRITPEDIHELQATCNFPPSTVPQAPAVGQVTIQGVLSLPAKPGNTYKYAITGGTDAYANARGEVTFIEPPAGQGTPLEFNIEV